MSKMYYVRLYYVTNSQTSPSAGGFPPSVPLTFNIVNLKFPDLAK